MLISQKILCQSGEVKTSNLHQTINKDRIKVEGINIIHVQKMMTYSSLFFYFSYSCHKNILPLQVKSLLQNV